MEQKSETYDGAIRGSCRCGTIYPSVLDIVVFDGCRKSSICIVNGGMTHPGKLKALQWSTLTDSSGSLMVTSTNAFAQSSIHFSKKTRLKCEHDEMNSSIGFIVDKNYKKHNDKKTKMLFLRL
jgi:hypothetical protein